MELRQLEYLVAVVEEASFTRAAARLHVAQPGVSAQIRQLERELGHALLDRSTRTVQLTEAGAAVLPHARAALQAVANARVAIDELVGLLRGHVSVGTVAARGPVDLPGWLADFHRDHPGVARGVPCGRIGRMSVTVRVPTILRPLTGGAAEVSVEGATLADVLDALEADHTGIRARVLDEDGKLRRFVNVYVNDDDVRFAEGLATPTPDGASVSIIPAVAGG